MTSTLTSLSKAPRPRGGVGAHEVLRQLCSLCAELKPGGVVPRHTELMQRFDASERAVRWALAELQQQGAIGRRPGAGTVVLDKVVDGSARYGAQGHGFLNGEVAYAAKSASAIQSRTVVAIARPDEGVFDHALRLLAGRAEAKELFLQCQLVATSGVAETSQLPAAAVEPLGYVVFRHALLPLARQLAAQGHRVVLVGAPPASAHIELPNVYGNHEQGGFQATKHLLELGHRRIAFVGDDDAKQTLRWGGYERALAEWKRRDPATCESEWFPFSKCEAWRSHPQSAREYFTRADAPTGLVAWNDTMALELLAFLTAIGVRVPHDVSLIGYDNLPQGQKSFPALTTLETNLEYQLEAALDVLTAPQTPLAPPTIITLPTLVRRDSCAPPR